MISPLALPWGKKQLQLANLFSLVEVFVKRNVISLGFFYYVCVKWHDFLIANTLVSSHSSWAKTIKVTKHN